MQQNWACRLGGWFLWGSLGVLIAVSGAALALPFVANSSEDAGEVMLNVLQVGFALVLGAFLLGAGCHLIEGRIGGGRGARR